MSTQSVCQVRHCRTLCIGEVCSVWADLRIAEIPGIYMCLAGDGTNIYGAIIQVDGVPKEEDFPKSPFTYFRNAYSDPGELASILNKPNAKAMRFCVPRIRSHRSRYYSLGFWIKPSEGKYAPRKFTQPKTVDQSHANTSTDDIGRIRCVSTHVCAKRSGVLPQVFVCSYLLLR